MSNLKDVIERSYAKVLEASGDVVRVAEVLVEIKSEILNAFVLEDIQEALAKGKARNIPVVNAAFVEKQGYVGRLKFDEDGKLIEFAIGSAFNG